MPYRRLPKTDVTRVKALQAVIDKCNQLAFSEQIVNFGTLNKAKNLQRLFENKMGQYQQAINNELTSNKRYRHLMSNAKIYISHFIQVLNLAVIRGDVKREHKEYYQLDCDNNTVPELSSENDILTWGKRIIDGENSRLSKGGFPIYNPTIAKVRVHYDIFKEYFTTQQLHRQSTLRNRKEVDKIRFEVDEILFEVWNQVEAYYADCKPYDKLCKCQAYGLIYYYRRKEKELTPEDDLVDFE